MKNCRLVSSISLLAKYVIKVGQSATEVQFYYHLLGKKSKEGKYKSGMAHPYSIYVYPRSNICCKL